MEAVAINDQSPTYIPGNGDGPLVAVTFQKNPLHIRKYLEAEPKALGLTQITLSIFLISMVLGSIAIGMGTFSFDVVQVFASLFVLIAGSIAIAAQNLHLPTLKACLGMQVVACAASIVNVMLSSGKAGHSHQFCWSPYLNGTESTRLCYILEKSIEHFIAEEILIHTALVAICVTLAVYCCKVIHCCTPTSSMPVITINAPPAQE
ncbi:hypothetical protein AAFF_G00324940 [Aldrovandia affinis]|uniref:Membrane-spanning 4-domains subfamily A member 4A-like n=1 Tax=Aldrovandia affinis TaxID=143900 RepID=A0AAD7TAL0_9TELE|nr:hypothetical protein AAFF_G00324940 [Aldrovandia affinis]